MQIGKILYGAAWLVFLSTVLLPRWMGVHAGYSIHILLGLVTLFVIGFNTRRLTAMRVPRRLKHIGKLIMEFTAFQIIFGAALGALMLFSPDIPYISPILRAAHFVCALAILAQTCSLATAYEMWEEKEFEKI